ncbi:MAG: hypothetical protein CMP05_01460 [Xanthomarina sp.]|uniref:hypothetical protein n=1 Tax=Xanthomarina sp. TaxID=1931211 RepID=UPI000C629571|nr:hypothetical protein [Xanthomarina sp.]MAL23201.1 hypothetical protein [Xanthomarina sp.]MBF60646.1 hypothetical protein [Xanthomarina sp.]HAI18258.1 hypothetical protein [Xanthomarina gelatinilytica]
MKKLFIIDSLDIDRGNIVAYNHKAYEPVFLKQGDADGACGPYCVMMALIISGVVNYDEVTDLWNIKLSSRLGKLVKAMREHDTLFAQGTSSKELSKLLDASFGAVIENSICQDSGKSVIAFAIEQLRINNPVIVGIKNGNLAHWLLAVGFEENDNAVAKLVFLDPSGKDISSYWNAAIDVLNTQRGRYPYAWIDHNNNNNEFVQFDEALAIIKN